MSPGDSNPAGERPQTYTLDRAATGTGNYPILLNSFLGFYEPLHILLLLMDLN